MKPAIVFILAMAVIGLAQDRHQMGSNYYAYPTPNAKYTKAPAGYKPFYTRITAGTAAASTSPPTITTLYTTRLQKPTQPANLPNSARACLNAQNTWTNTPPRAQAI